MKLTIIVLAIGWGTLSAQETVSLDSCFVWARENYPGLKKEALLNDLSGLNDDNIRTEMLPRIVVSGQATYQSDVTRVDIPLPQIVIPSLSKDQYRMFTEIRQNFWDGGVSKARRQLEQKILTSALSETEIEVYRLKEQVSTAFFTFLSLSLHIKAVKAQQSTLESRLQNVRAAISHGTAEQASAKIIEAEILQLASRLIELQAAQQTTAGILSWLSGKPFDGSSILETPDLAKPYDAVIRRPELGHFDDLIAQHDAAMALRKKMRNPKIIGFGQTGYGKPGLNMLKNGPDTWYLIGAGINWTITDWGNARRDQHIAELNKSLIATEKETYMHHLELLRIKQWELIDQLHKQTANDLQLTELRNEILNNSESKLRNGTITPSDYIRDLNLATVTQIQWQLRKLQIAEAIVMYNIIIGL